LRYLSNCAIALGCDSVLDLIEDELLEWMPLGEAQQPPAPLPDWKPGRPSTLDRCPSGIEGGTPGNEKHKVAIQSLPDERRQLYRHIRRQAGDKIDRGSKHFAVAAPDLDYSHTEAGDGLKLRTSASPVAPSN